MPSRKPRTAPPTFVGCAGWSIPAQDQAAFSAVGTHLEKYATRLSASEINSSFHRPHKPETYARWAAAVPDHFRFSVKIPKTISHELRLAGATEALAAFMGEASMLGDKLGCLLVQLPPSLAFDAAVARRFFAELRSLYRGAAALEPRHASWFSAAAERLLAKNRIARVAADPAPVAGAAHPAGWGETIYYRLHGSPRRYYSAYDDAYLERLRNDLAAHRATGAQVWCIFDNTASGAALGNALALDGLLTGNHP
jgi:uncharacterized protein YecE (DUF72 family)